MSDVNEQSAASSGGRRAQQAAQSRRRMTAAAYRLFVERGYPDTTMAAVAEAAGVAVQTLYFTFGTKAQLLQHVYEFAVMGDSLTPPQAQPWYQSLGRSERLDEALAILAEAVGAVFARTAPLDEFVRAASSEPDAARIRAHNEQLRRDGWTDFIDTLSQRFPLRGGVDRQRAVDILMTLMSPSTYVALVADCHWTPTQWSAWCADATSQQIFAPRSAS